MTDKMDVAADSGTFFKEGGLLALFQGASSLSGEARSTAVSGETSSAEGYENAVYTFCSDFESFKKSLDVEQSVSVGFGLFGASEKTHFITQTNQSAWSINLVVRAVNVTGNFFAKNWRLNSDVKSPVDYEEKREFFRVYGDSFVSSIKYGSEYIAVFTFSLQSEEEKNEAITSLEASGLLGQLAIGAGLQNKISDYMEKTKLKVTLHQTILGGKKISLPSVDKIIDFANNFFSIEPESPEIISIGATGYERIPGFGDFSPIPQNRIYFLGDGYKSGLFSDFEKITTLRNQIARLQALYRVYGDFQDEAVKKVKNLADAEYDAILLQASDFESDPTRTFAKPDIQSITSGLPVVQYDWGYSGEYGGNGGRPFDDISDEFSSVPSFIAKASHIKQIRLYKDEYGYLEIVYESEGINNSSTETTILHGKEKINGKAPLRLLNKEWIKSVSGYAGNYVDWLSVSTTRERITENADGGTANFTWNVPDGSVLIGFRGRDGAYIDRLQMIYLTLHPAAWIDAPSS